MPFYSIITEISIKIYPVLSYDIRLPGAPGNRHQEIKRAFHCGGIQKISIIL